MLKTNLFKTKVSKNTSSAKLVDKWQLYLLQASIIFVVVLLSLNAAFWVLERVLVKQALELEAQSFIEERELDPNFPLPRTRNLIGYLVCDDCAGELPPELSALPQGLHLDINLQDKPEALPVYVKDSNLGRLYLVFEGQNVDRLVGFFGIVPLGLMLIVIYVTSWLAYQFSARAISPVLRMARGLQNTASDEAPLDIATDRFKGEARELALAIEDYTKRMDAMVEREQQFSADVSHELRTPITIIDGAAQFIETDRGLSNKSQERIRMIRRASRDISELVEAFLILGRDPRNIEVTESLAVAIVVESELRKLRSVVGDKNVELRVVEEASLNVSVNQKVLEIIIGNLCRNAIKHTEDGHVTVTIKDHQVVVEDTGSGMDEDILPIVFDRHIKGPAAQKAGEGLGLNIVKRLCDLYGWKIEIANKAQGGVSVTLTIPN
ncbi:MAG: HAMP domain-containing sensor histidine kinase [Pseudomonadota bacterium]